MDDRRRHASLSHLGLFAIVAVSVFAALKGRSRARTGLRLLGLWAYLSVVNRGAANAGLARDVNRGSQPNICRRKRRPTVSGSLSADRCAG